MRRALACLALVLLVSCSEEPDTKAPPAPAPAPSEQAAPQAVAPAPSDTSAEQAAPSGYSLDIAPPEAGCGTKLTLSARGFSLDDAVAVWIINGDERPVSADNALNPAEARLKKNDVVRARARVGGVVVLSNEVKVKNTLPELTGVKIMPEVFKPGDKVHVDAEARDQDGDAVSIAYEWTLNGKPSGTGSALDAKLKRGDTFMVKVVPHDGFECGPGVLLHRVVGNMPPQFAEGREDFHFIGQDYTFQPRATDPDGDPISYSLKSGPEGMTVDRITGLVRWTVPPGLKGMQQFTLSAQDGKGGESLKTYNLTFTVEQPAGGAVNAPGAVNTPGAVNAPSDTGTTKQGKKK